MIRKRLSKRNAAIIMTGVLSIAMASTVMAAPGGPGGNAGPGGRAGSQGGFEHHGQMPELPTFEDGERPELPELDESERPELPEGEMPEHPEMKDVREMKGINTDSIQTAIEDLDDEDVKSDLETLLAEYTEAKSALDSAIESESEDIDTYRKAEMDAMKALREALDEAGIDTRPELPEEDGERPELDNDPGQTGRQIIREDLNGARQNDQNLSDSDKSELTNRSRTINKFAKWLESLFS